MNKEQLKERMKKVEEEFKKAVEQQQKINAFIEQLKGAFRELEAQLKQEEESGVVEAEIVKE